MIPVVLAAYDRCKNVKQIMRETKLNRETIRQILFAHNITPVNAVLVTSRKYTIDHDAFQEINTPEKAYWIGLLAADGTIDEVKRAVRLGLKEEDLYMIERFRDFLKSNKPIYTDRKTLNGKVFVSRRFEAISVKIVDDLARVGIFARKSFTLPMPKIPTDLYSHFIRGYFDGDGCITFNNCKGYVMGEASIITSLECGQIITSVLKQQGINARLTTTKHTNGIDRMYIVRMSGIFNMEIFCDYIYKDSTIHLNRKHEKYLYLKELTAKSHKRGKYLRPRDSGSVAYAFSHLGTKYYKTFPSKEEAFRTCLSKMREVGALFLARKLIINNPDMSKVAESLKS